MPQDDSEPAVFCAAARALARVAPNEPATRAALLPRLHDARWERRVAAVLALNTPADGLALVADANWKVRCAAAQAIAEGTPGDAELAAALRRLFGDQNGQVRLAAAKAAGRVLRVPANAAEVAELERIVAARTDWRVSVLG